MRVGVLAGYQLGISSGAFNLSPNLCSDCWAPKNCLVFVYGSPMKLASYEAFLWRSKVFYTLAIIECLCTRCNCVYVQIAGHQSTIVVFVYGSPMKLVRVWSFSVKVQGVWLRKSRVLVLGTVYMFRLQGTNKDVIVFEYGGSMKLDILRSCTIKVIGFYFACKMRLKSWI